MSGFFDTPIEFLKGVGPQKADVLKKELGIHTFGDLVQHYPYRHEDRSEITPINRIHEEMPHAQVKGRLINLVSVGDDKKKRLVGTIDDGTGKMDLIWFQGVSFILKNIKIGETYLIYGKPQIFNYHINIPHPEIDVFDPAKKQTGFLQPIYHTSERMKKLFIDSKTISRFQRTLIDLAHPQIPETLPEYIKQKYKLCSKADAVCAYHYPENRHQLDQASRRLKFEELFYIQLQMLNDKVLRKSTYRGHVFHKAELVKEFYDKHLPFQLTGAQKRVLHEIHNDFKSGQQMNRLLQGDVGSGKTMVAFITMLMAASNGFQACLMAPTEILADQHYKGLIEFTELLGLRIVKLTGSVKTAQRRIIHEGLQNGEIHFVVGTHALIEDTVVFKNLGLCVVDEQHRFGVAQRAKLWKKHETVVPHVLVMTATPIPRTLAMTLYGDLDVSIIDELPAGRKAIKTVLRKDNQRLSVFGFMKDEIARGRQIYLVYPLIEESEKMDLKDLMDGFESISRAFQNVPLSMVHGRMKPADKDYEMARFVKGETKIMVATTVIEVGVNVPNASVMVIESAERFGLSQLHQLRGRVGRGAAQSYCILMSSHKLSSESRVRLNTMVQTNNGFEIADVDLKLRGPGDLAGTKQSGVLDLLVADLAQDTVILKEARITAEAILDNDPHLELAENFPIKAHVGTLKKGAINWARIS